MKLSVVIITYNEERNMERCLKSVETIADEILVVDSFSTDRTEEICKQYQVRWIQHKFEGYGSQKRYATEQARFDCILSLDADEELSSELAQAISVVKLNWMGDCYSFNRRNFYCNKPIRFCGWYPDKKIRLYDRRQVNWNNKNVHESIEVQKEHKVMHLKGDLNHYTCTSIAEHKKTANKYANMSADILINKGKSIAWITPYVKGFFKFFNIYIIKLGIMDGYYGLVIAIISAKSSFDRYFLSRNILLKGRKNKMLHY